MEDSTDRKNVVKRPELSEGEIEQKYRVLFESVADPIWLFDLQDGSIIDYNPIAQQSLGYSPEELALLKINDIDVKLDPEEIEGLITQLVKEGNASFESLHQTKSGEIRNVKINLKHIILSGKSCALGTARDITELRRTEENTTKLLHELGGRLRELNCFYGIFKLSSKYDSTLEDLMTGTAALLPPAFQFSKVACARIILDGKEFKTDDFRETPWGLNSAIVVREKRVGQVDVGYLEERPEADEGPFLKEERLLINAIAEQVGRMYKQRQAEEALHYQATLLKSVTDAVITTDLDFNIQSWNSTAEAMYGWRAEEVIGVSMEELVPGEYPNDQREAVLAKFQSDGVWQGEVIQKHKDGNDLYVLASVTMVKDDAGQPISVLAVNRNITALKKAVEEASYEQGLMRTLLETTPDYVYFKDKDRRFVRASNSFSRLFNLDLKEIIGKRDEDLFPPEIAEETVRDDQRVIETGTPLIGKVEGGGSIGGNPAWVITTKLPWIGLDGEIVGMFGISKDMTENKIAEQKLRESEARYRHLVENISEVIYAVDMEGIMTYVSPAIESIIGLSPEQVIGQPFTQFLVPEDKDRSIENVQQLMSGLSSGITEYRVETISGEIRWIRVSSQINLDGERVTGVQGVVTDITEIKRVEGQLEKAAAAAERQRLARELHDSVTQTLYGIDLFSNASQQALSTGKIERAMENAREIRVLSRSALADMRLLIYELQPPTLEEKGLTNALRERLDLVEARTGFNTNFRVTSDRRLHRSIEAELYAVATEALNNTLKHSGAEQVSVILRFDLQNVSLTISDDGIGYDPASIKGTGGFGLRSMKQRVERIGGSLSLESSPEKGTTVRVEVAA